MSLPSCNSITTFDLFTIYTSIPHPNIKYRLINSAIKYLFEKNHNCKQTLIVTKSFQKLARVFDCQHTRFYQIAGHGNSCGLKLIKVDSCHYSYEADFTQVLLRKKQINTVTFRYHIMSFCWIFQSWVAILIVSIIDRAIAAENLYLHI